ncbi:MAG: hypothetical protein SFW67_21025, partial [Myxococcaceae bacterium]|nr:hypothetical protein [Myxococcaceae bacterium]
GAAGGMTAGGAAGGATAGGAAPEPDDLLWPDGGWRQNLTTSPLSCIVVQLQARLGGQPFVFAAATPPVLSLLLDNGAPALPGADGGPSVSLTTSCGNSSPPQFAADASVANIAITSRRVGVYRIQASLGPLQKTSGPLTAAPNAWAAFPADGGSLRIDGGTACVEMVGRALPWQTASNADPQRFLEAGMNLTFNLPATSGWTLTRNCSQRTPASSITITPGADAVRFGLLVSVLDGGAFFMELPPAVPQYGLSGGMRFTELQVENDRLCTPAGMTPGNRCSDLSECCVAATECSPPPGMDFLTCR